MFDIQNFLLLSNNIIQIQVKSSSIIIKNIAAFDHFETHWKLESQSSTLSFLTCEAQLAKDG